MPETGEPDGSPDRLDDRPRWPCWARPRRRHLGHRQPRADERRPQPLNLSRRPRRSRPMHSHYLFLALDLARERAAEADSQRLAALARLGAPRKGRVRRLVARAALAVARAADEQALPQMPL